MIRPEAKIIVSQFGSPRPPSVKQGIVEGGASAATALQTSLVLKERKN
jgi:hypothetical protein